MEKEIVTNRRRSRTRGRKVVPPSGDHLDQRRDEARMRSRNGGEMIGDLVVKAESEGTGIEGRTRDQITQKRQSRRPNNGNRGQARGKAEQTVRIVPLGGLSEIGKNMTAIEYGNDIIVVDCGFAFPGDNMLGIDYVIPDFNYLKERKDKVRGYLITHGHEDHIGAIPYALKEVPAPIYGGVLTMGLIQYKLDEHGVKGIHLQRVKGGETVKLGVFETTFIPVCHSISDAFGLKIKTPVGSIVHTGDFKIDHSPIDGRRMDLGAFARAGEEGVLLLMSDSTNADREGYTPSEQQVAGAFEACIEKARGRVIVATFSSNVSRIQQLVEIAEKHGRKIYFAGRSMSKIVDIASDLGYIRIKKGSQVNDRGLDFLEPEEVVIITTGSQGEPMSGLQRMSTDDHRLVHLRQGDTVVISASPIPGNEKAVIEMMDRLYQLGVDVVSYNTTRAVHVSGHACQEEQKLVIALTKPKFFMPIHGEYHHMMAHAQTARGFGIPEENIRVARNGNVLALTENHFQVTEELPNEAIFVDGSGIGDVGSIVIRDRQLLSNDGLFVVIATIDRQGKLVAEPEVMSRGFVYVKESEALMRGAREVAKKAVLANTGNRRGTDWGNIKNAVRNAVRTFLYGETKRNPVILPVIMEVDLGGKK